MGRGKKKRKLKLKKKREMKKKKGKYTPFTISNCPKKLKGIERSYQYKINVHNCCFNDAKFEKVRYRAGHITYSYLRKATFKNVDFIFLNLKKSSFKGSNFIDVVFNGCNLDGVNFSDCSFKNVYFINCKISKELRKQLQEKIIIINTNNILISEELKKTILSTGKIKSLEKYRILTISNNKINKMMVGLLTRNYTEVQIIKFLGKIVDSNKMQMFTLHDYIYSMDKYYNN